MKTTQYSTTDRKFGVTLYSHGTHFEAQIHNRKSGQVCGLKFGATVAEVEAGVAAFLAI
jgi:hypothetical protein